MDNQTFERWMDNLRPGEDETPSADILAGAKSIWSVLKASVEGMPVPRGSCNDEAFFMSWRAGDLYLELELDGRPAYGWFFWDGTDNSTGADVGSYNEIPDLLRLFASRIAGSAPERKVGP